MVYLVYIILLLITVVVFSSKARKRIIEVLIGRIFREYLIFLCSIMIGASAGVITIFLAGMAVVFVTELGFNPKLAETDILVSNSKIIWFMGIYGILLGSMFWYIKKILKKEL